MRLFVCNVDHPTKTCRSCDHFYPHEKTEQRIGTDLCDESHKCREQKGKTVCCIMVEDKCC